MLLRLAKMSLPFVKHYLQKLKKNKKLNSTENLYNCEKETNVLNESLTASQKGMKVRK